MVDRKEVAGGDHSNSAAIAKERPWLLPSNRKLRHLQGISIRNLVLVPPPNQNRTKTIDDDALPSTLKSPTKALALRESKKLEHSRSSSDLRSSGDAVRQQNSKSSNESSPTTPTRPSLGKGLRRRSTMDWTGASPLARQKKLEDVTGGRMADTFFSLHVEGFAEPMYISEVVEKAMNPSFRFFDLEACGPGVTRKDTLLIRVWARNEHMKKWQYLIEYSIQLPALQFIGKSLGNFNHPLPPNCILFHMTDGIYTSFTDLPAGKQIPFEPAAAPKASANRTLPSSSYDALMRLSTLDDCIQDAIATRDRLAGEIESILENNKEAISTVTQVPEAEERAKTVEQAVAAERRRLEAAKRRRDELEASIEARKKAIEAGRELQTSTEKDMEAGKEKVAHCKQTIQSTEEDIHGQRRRVCEELLWIYPIEPIPGKSLLFTIRGLTLPNSEFEDAKEDVISAALGYVAQIVHLLSPYLSVPLPYPIKPHGSTSLIDDPISMTTGPRTYPLFMKGVVKYRFEYGVFLLNKNIEVSANSLGLRLLDVRQTLPNLKYLLFVATAGKGELPARKAGGVRGLLRQGVPMSRTASVDSTGSTADGNKETLLETAKSHQQVDTPKSNGKPVSAYQSLQKNAVLKSSRLREVD